MVLSGKDANDVPDPQRNPVAVESHVRRSSRGAGANDAAEPTSKRSCLLTKLQQSDDISSDEEPVPGSIRLAQATLGSRVHASDRSLRELREKPSVPCWVCIATALSQMKHVEGEGRTSWNADHLRSVQSGVTRRRARGPSFRGSSRTRLVLFDSLRKDRVRIDDL